MKKYIQAIRIDLANLEKSMEHDHLRSASVEIEAIAHHTSCIRAEITVAIDKEITEGKIY